MGPTQVRLPVGPDPPVGAMNQDGAAKTKYTHVLCVCVCVALICPFRVRDRVVEVFPDPVRGSKVRGGL